MLFSRKGLNKNKSIKGLSLTELMLAASILAAVLCGLILLFVNCLMLNEANRNLLSAVTHAEYVMEEIRDANFSFVESLVTSGTWDWTETNLESENLIPLVEESIDASVFQSGDPLGVLVTVNWKDNGGRDRVAQITTLITDY